MTPPKKVTIDQYDSKKTIDYAWGYWNKVCDDGRVLTSSGVFPGCGQKAIKDGYPLIIDKTISRSYGWITPGEFLVASDYGYGDSYTETWQYQTIKDTATDFVQDKAVKWVFWFKKPLGEKGQVVKDINIVQIDTDGTTHKIRETLDPPTSTFTLRRVDDPSPQTYLGLVARHPDDSPKQLETKDNKDALVQFGEGSQFSIHYSYFDQKTTRIAGFGAMEDCCHFISSCLHAGGLPVPKQKGRECSNGLHGADGIYNLFKALEKRKQVEFVKDKEGWKKKGESDTDTDARWLQTFQDKMQPGDAVIYHHQGKPAHTVIYVGIMKMKQHSVDFPRITCHTYSRYPSDDCVWNDCRWDLGRTDDKWSYSLVHILSRK